MLLRFGGEAVPTRGQSDLNAKARLGWGTRLSLLMSRKVDSRDAARAVSLRSIGSGLLRGYNLSLEQEHNWPASTDNAEEPFNGPEVLSYRQK